MAHPWLQNGEFATAEEVRAEFTKRHETNKAITKAENEKKQTMKAQSNAQIRRDFVLGAKVYKHVDNPSLSDADKSDPNTVLLALKDWQD